MAIRIMNMTIIAIVAAMGTTVVTVRVGAAVGAALVIIIMTAKAGAVARMSA